jgi:D-3-phosphoglycerate dehydrogenase
VILTPHTAGMPDGRKFHKKRYDFFINNIRRVENGEEPESKLNQFDSFATSQMNH